MLDGLNDRIGEIGFGPVHVLNEAFFEQLFQGEAGSDLPGDGQALMPSYFLSPFALHQSALLPIHHVFGSVEMWFQ
jgi:hypothetical protein